MPETPPPTPAEPIKPPPPPEPAADLMDTRCDRSGRIVLLAVFAFGLWAFPRYGVTTDEPIRSTTGENWWKWLGTGDPQYLPDNRLRYYGALFDMICVKASELHAALGGTDKFVAKHLVIFLAMWLGLLGTYKLAKLLGPQPFPLIALLVLTLMPRFTGSFNNPKDIPFATAFVWTVYAMIRWVGEPSWKTTLFFAVCTGLSTATRPFGILFLPIGIVAGLLAWWVGPKEPVIPPAEGTEAPPAPPSMGKLVAGFGVSALAFSYLFWPTLWISSPLHLAESLRYLSKFPDGGASQYFGEVFNRDDFAKRSIEFAAGTAKVEIPAHVTFIPVWTAITIPAVTLGLMFCGLLVLLWWTIRRCNPGWAWWFVAAWLLVPWIAACLRGSNYSRTGRHFMFLFPAVALFASLALSALIGALRERKIVWLPAAVFAVLYAEVAFTAARLFPYESLYFSHIVGGVRGVAGDGTSSKKTKFDIENWSQSFAEAFAWLAANCDEKDPKLVHVHAVTSTDVGLYHARQWGMHHNTDTPRYFISMWMQGGDEKFPGEVIHTVEREGVPLTVVKRITPLVPLSNLYVESPQRGMVRLVGDRGRFNLTEAGIQVPPMTSYSAEDEAGTLVKMSWKVRSDAARTLRVYVGFKGPGKATVNGKTYPIGDRLRFLAFDSFAGMVFLDVELKPGVNEFTAEGTIRHDPSVHVHWPRTDGVVSVIE